MIDWTGIIFGLIAMFGFGLNNALSKKPVKKLLKKADIKILNNKVVYEDA